MASPIVTTLALKTVKHVLIEKPTANIVAETKSFV
jgi:predicted dehydrogenase